MKGTPEKHLFSRMRRPALRQTQGGRCSSAVADCAARRQKLSKRRFSELPKKYSIFLTSLFFIALLMSPVRAALNPANELDFCKIKIQEALTDTMCCFGDKKEKSDANLPMASESTNGNRTIRLGYANQLSNLLSTNEQSYLNLSELEELARDAKIELQGICEEAGKLDQMSEAYATVYDLNACKYMSKFTSSTTENRLVIFNFCEQEKDKRLEAFLDQLEPYLMRQAIRTSFEPLVQALRTMNSKLLSLLTEYQRAVKNFYKFSFRLGETIVGKPN